MVRLEDEARLTMATWSALRASRRRGHRAEDLTERFRTRVVAAFPGRVERIVLFGSRAQGEPHADSDWDLAVFLDHEPTAQERAALREIDFDLQEELGAQIQGMLFAGQEWLATHELACNIRDQIGRAHV